MSRTATIPAILLDDLDLIDGEHAKLAALVKLPPVDLKRWRAMMADACRAATQKLTVAGATIATKGNQATIGFRDIVASSDMGLVGALGAWATEARKELGK